MFDYGRFVWGLFTAMAVGMVLTVRVGTAAEESSSPSSMAPPAALGENVSTPGRPNLILNAGPGLVFYSGDYAQLYKSGSVGYSINAGVLSQIQQLPIYAGLDFGLDFFSFDNPPGAAGANVGRSAVGIQFLPSVVYRFEEITSAKLSPYFGFSFGPHFFVSRARTLDFQKNEISSNTNTDVYLELLARPGVDFNIADGVAVNVEPKFGILNLDFVFLPQVNFVLAM